MNDLAPVLGITTMFAFGAWVLRTLILSLRDRKIADLQAELQTRLLEKFTSNEELLGYLQSDAGEKLVQPLREQGAQSPYGRILGAVQVGVILLCAGGACLFLDGRLPFDDQRGFLFLGTVGTAVGIGFLLSGAVAYVLSRSWGLLEPSREA